MGLEFSGRDSKGKRVMGMVAARSLATTVLADPTFLWEIPANWTLEQASSVPVVYGTVCVCLLIPQHDVEYFFIKNCRIFFLLRHTTLWL